MSTNRRGMRGDQQLQPPENMPVKIAFNPENAHLSVKVYAGERQQVHGSFLETLRRLVKRAKQINVDLTELPQVDDKLLMVMDELRALSGDSTIILRTRKGSKTEASLRTLFENRQTIMRH
jgi:hypothetical protein